jgi:hypothetical protein
MWKENAPGKAAFVPPRVPSDSDLSDGSSDATEWERARSASSGPGSTGSQTVYNHARSRSRSGSIITNASRGSLQVTSGSASASSPTSMRWTAGPTPPDSPKSVTGDLSGGGRPIKPRGYELCVACIEVHGIAHSKAAAKADRRSDSRRRKAGGLRHTFREKIWGTEGWQDVGESHFNPLLFRPADEIEYNEDSECTICRSLLFNNRFKCVSCPKFDLCRSCGW